MPRVVALIVVLFHSVAFGGGPYCRISGTTSSSGCAIENRNGFAHIITSAQGKADKEQVKVHFYDSKGWVEGVVAAIDTDLDLAVVVCPSQSGLKTVQRANETPLTGEATHAGFGNGSFVVGKTKILGQQTANIRNSTRRDFIRAETTSRAGDGGGPYLVGGRLIGVQSAYLDDGKDSLFVPVEDVNRFLVETAGWVETSDAVISGNRRREKASKALGSPIACVRIRQIYYNRTAAGIVVQTRVQSGAVISRDKKSGVSNVLTCAHGLDERGPVQLLVSHIDLEMGQIVAIDRDRDLAVVTCTLPQSVVPVELAARSPDANVDATIIGYGGGWWDTTYVEEATKVLRIEDNPTRSGGKLIRIDAATRHGDSGGPLLHNGQLVGVQVRGDGRNGWEVPVEDVIEFLVARAGWKSVKAERPAGNATAKESEQRVTNGGRPRAGHPR